MSAELQLVLLALLEELVQYVRTWLELSDDAEL